MSAAVLTAKSRWPEQALRAGRNGARHRRAADHPAGSPRGRPAGSRFTFVASEPTRLIRNFRSAAAGGRDRHGRACLKAALQFLSSKFLRRVRTCQTARSATSTRTLMTVRERAAELRVATSATPGWSSVVSGRVQVAADIPDPTLRRSARRRVAGQLDRDRTGRPSASVTIVLQCCEPRSIGHAACSPSRNSTSSCTRCHASSATSTAQSRRPRAGPHRPHGDEVLLRTARRHAAIGARRGQQQMRAPAVRCHTRCPVSVLTQRRSEVRSGS